MIEPGQKAPTFSLKDQFGDRYALKDMQGAWVVLYFYPKDDTPGCTKEACGFRDEIDAFEQADAKVFGISPDDEKSHAKFSEKFALPFPLLADPDKQVCEKYGVWQEKNSFGRKTTGVVRTTYLIDPAGKVARRWDKVKVDGHPQQVLEAIEAGGSSD